MNESHVHMSPDLANVVQLTSKSHSKCTWVFSSHPHGHIFKKQTLVLLHDIKVKHW